MPHFAFDQRQIGTDGFTYTLLEILKTAVKHIGSVFDCLVAIGNHLHFANIRTRRIVAARPETMLCGPIAILLVIGLLRTLLDIFLEVIESRMHILYIKPAMRFVNKPERPMAVLP